jgi:hypothetical protein
MPQRYAAPILFFVIQALLCAQGGKLEPVDESGRDPALSLFLDRVREAVGQPTDKLLGGCGARAYACRVETPLDTSHPSGTPCGNELYRHECRYSTHECVRHVIL